MASQLIRTQSHCVDSVLGVSELSFAPHPLPIGLDVINTQLSGECAALTKCVCVCVVVVMALTLCRGRYCTCPLTALLSNVTLLSSGEGTSFEAFPDILLDHVI